jgi:2-amino-4-hydroxy-6-hydroxymethyldihydropteridine diphosphokinase
MVTVYLALGSNVGDRLSHIRQATDLLEKEIHNLKRSHVYESRPFGYTEQDNFLNAAVEGTTNLSVAKLLKFLKGVEKTVGRVESFHWGPREIDIDILFYGDLSYHGKGLDIPHPGIRERDFVLRPLMDLNKNLVHPVYGKTVQQLYDELKKEDLYVIGDGRRM